MARLPLHRVDRLRAISGHRPTRREENAPNGAHMGISSAKDMPHGPQTAPPALLRKVLPSAGAVKSVDQGG